MAVIGRTVLVLRWVSLLGDLEVARPVDYPRVVKQSWCSPVL